MSFSLCILASRSNQTEAQVHEREAKCSVRTMFVLQNFCVFAVSVAMAHNRHGISVRYLTALFPPMPKIVKTMDF